ncbi:MAG: hypothetical protein Q8L82_02105, partial [Nitrosomonas sp.]|nr:hypothetical protein [Nitrosomonas sp.]
FFDLGNRYDQLSKLKDPLVELNRVIDWNLFADLLQGKRGRYPLLFCWRSQPSSKQSSKCKMQGLNMKFIAAYATGIQPARNEGAFSTAEYSRDYSSWQ